MENFRPFNAKSELIRGYYTHTPDKRKDYDLLLVLLDKFNSLARVFRLKNNSEFPYDIEDGSILDWNTLYENYTFLDGSPCGRLLEES